MARASRFSYDPRLMDDLEKLAEILTELEVALRRLALDLGLFAVRVSSMKSDGRVVEVPRQLTRFKRQDFLNN
jgi:hypothetical protein